MLGFRPALEVFSVFLQKVGTGETNTLFCLNLYDVRATTGIVYVR
jgi:hypothetical protein